MKTQPGWPLWLAWFVAYTILDMLFAVVLLHSNAWNDVAGSLAGAIIAATLTWLFAYRRWLKSDSLY